MLGDIVPTTNPNGEPVSEQSRPTPSPQTVESRSVASATTQAPSVSVPVAKRGGRVPLVLTLVGVIVFIGGVSGLFVYALGGS